LIVAKKRKEHVRVAARSSFINPIARMKGKRGGGVEREEPGVVMTEEDTRDNTADAHAHAAGRT